MKIVVSDKVCRDMTPAEWNMLVFLYELQMRGLGASQLTLCGWGFRSADHWLPLVANGYVAGQDGTLLLTARGMRALTGEAPNLRKLNSQQT